MSEIEDKFFQALDVAEHRLGEIKEQLKHYEVTAAVLQSERMSLIDTVCGIKAYLKTLGIIQPKVVELSEDDKEDIPFK